jgi:AcrR family transcriptional regulator
MLVDVKERGGAEAAGPATGRPTTLGRPRAEDRTPAILEAAKALLEEVGYDRLRIQDVADRAGAGLATLYRRWPTKQALVADALRFHQEALLPPLLDDPRADLTALLCAMTSKLCGAGGEVLPGLVAALRSEPELAAVIRDEVMAPLRARMRADVASIVGPDNPQLDLLADLGPAVLMYRAVLVGEDVDVDAVVGSVLGLIDALTPADGARPR